MKFSKLFISVGICGTLIIGCKQPQKQVVRSNDEITWKATLTYCLSKETPDTKNPNNWVVPIEEENCDIYNFKITEQIGSFRNLLNTLFDSAISKTYPVYTTKEENNSFIRYTLFSQREKTRLVNSIDTIWDNNSGKIVAVSNHISPSWIKNLEFTHEWLYNSKLNTLTTTITDVSLNFKEPKLGHAIESPLFKFSKRTTDSDGFEQEALKPEIAWARDMFMAIRNDSVKGPDLDYFGRYQGDSIPRYTVNGVASKALYGFPLSIKTTFNIKLVEWIWTSARTGLVPAYYCVGEDSVGSQIPAKDMNYFGSSIDTVESENGNPIAVRNDLIPENLSGLEIKEEITFHKSTFTFDSKITYVGVLYKSFNTNTGKDIQNTSTVLYWVKLN